MSTQTKIFFFGVWNHYAPLHHIQIKMSFKFGLVPSTDPDNPVNESDLKLF